MKCKRFIALFAACLGLGSAFADDISLGYCDGNAVNGFVTGSNSENSAAILLDKDAFFMYAGCEMTGVRIGLNANVPGVTVFVRSALNGEDIYTEQFGSQYEGWNDIYFSQPFEFPEGDVYVGYTCKGSAAVGVSGIWDARGAYSLGKDGQWQEQPNTIGGSLCIQAVLDGTDFTTTDGELREVNTAIAAKGQPFVVSGSFRNNTNRAVKTLTVEYAINDGAKITKEAVAPEVLAGEIGSFSFEADPMENIGELDMDVTITGIDGQPDAYPGNSTASSTVRVISEIAPKKALLEYFTTQSCGNCPAAQSMWEKVLNGREDVIWISYHAGYGTDVFTTQEHEELCWFYGSNRTWAPAFMMDRMNAASHGAMSSSGTPAIAPLSTCGPEDFSNNIIDWRLSETPSVALELLRTYVPTERKLLIRVEARQVEGLAAVENPVMNVLLVEDGLVAYQSGGGDNYTHNHVVRHFVTPTWGDPVAFDGEGKFKKEYVVELPTSNKTQNMKVVAFVSNYNASNVNDCKVHNATYKVLEGEDFSGIDKTDIGSSVVIRQGEDGSGLQVETVASGQVFVYDMMGRMQLSSQLQPGGNDLALPCGHGIYLVKVLCGNDVWTQKVVLE